MKIKRIILAIALVSMAFAANAQQLGKTTRYCNPLPMVMGEGGTASGDVSVFQWQGKYYMFCTGGGAWVSDDMFNWEFHKVENVPTAPDVVPYNGKFIMTGNSTGVWVADNPLGPYEMIGNWKGIPGIEGGWSIPFDTHIYIDDDNQPYLFWPGMAISGIYSVKLNPNDITQFAGPITHHFSFNPDHVWERQGEQNEYTDVAWIEGPWVYKHNGTYYLQYSASGTQWRTYAEGYYKANSIEGPYEYASNNPFLRRTDGVVTGAAHGSMLTGPDGNIWQFYTIVLSSGGRRIGMDRVTVDEQGNLNCKITDTPQWIPGAVKDPTKGDSGSIIVSVGKINNGNAGGTTRAKVASTDTPGRGAEYAVDNSTATWWTPDPSDKQPTLTLNLSPSVDRDRTQTFTVDGIRLLFNNSRAGGFGSPTGELPEPAPNAVIDLTQNERQSSNRVATNGQPQRRMSFPFNPSVFKYKVEVSMDAKNYTTVLDRTDNTVSRNTIFDEFAPIECRFVRLTITEWPANTALSVLDFSVFGKATGYSPSEVAVPPLKDMSKK
ncbi:MAG: family 43 glycosylhydrolase [Bacteroidales bacterium]|nr:family 43 glycosylhydrolase [Bacteroidales bacterium]